MAVEKAYVKRENWKLLLCQSGSQYPMFYSVTEKVKKGTSSELTYNDCDGGIRGRGKDGILDLSQDVVFPGCLSLGSPCFDEDQAYLSTKSL